MWPGLRARPFREDFSMLIPGTPRVSLLITFVLILQLFGSCTICLRSRSILKIFHGTLFPTQSPGQHTQASFEVSLLHLEHTFSYPFFKCVGQDPVQVFLTGIMEISANINHQRFLKFEVQRRLHFTNGFQRSRKLVQSSKSITSKDASEAHSFCITFEGGS